VPCFTRFSSGFGASCRHDRPGGLTKAAATDCRFA
jgi:hypothetical protein